MLHACLCFHLSQPIMSTPTRNYLVGLKSHLDWESRQGLLSCSDGFNYGNAHWMRASHTKRRDRGYFSRQPTCTLEVFGGLKCLGKPTTPHVCWTGRCFRGAVVAGHSHTHRVGYTQPVMHVMHAARLHFWPVYWKFNSRDSRLFFPGMRNNFEDETRETRFLDLTLLPASV